MSWINPVRRSKIRRFSKERQRKNKDPKQTTSKFTCKRASSAAHYRSTVPQNTSFRTLLTRSIYSPLTFACFRRKS
jgi:hypothetical protein